MLPIQPRSCLAPRRTRKHTRTLTAPRSHRRNTCAFPHDRPIIDCTHSHLQGPRPQTNNMHEQRTDDMTCTYARNSTRLRTNTCSRLGHSPRQPSTTHRTRPTAHGYQRPPQGLASTVRTCTHHRPTCTHHRQGTRTREARPAGYRWVGTHRRANQQTLVELTDAPTSPRSHQRSHPRTHPPVHGPAQNK
jgi:hypothetical protein